MDARSRFDGALTAYEAGEHAYALRLFTAVTESSPTISDAWLGRIACGDHNIETLANAHTNSAWLYKETNRWQKPKTCLRCEVATPRYVKLPVWSRSSIALAYASALITEQSYNQASEVLADPVITSDTGAAQWRQLITAGLYYTTGRWHDIQTLTAVSPPPEATNTHDILTAAVDTIAAWAAAYLAQNDIAIDTTTRILAAVTPADNAYIVSDAHTIRGYCLRARGEHASAKAAFESAVVDGQQQPGARDALQHPDWLLTTTTAEQIGTRTNRWDHNTETTPAQAAAAATATARTEALTRAQTLLDSLIGLDGPKEEVEVWRTEKAIDAMLATPGSRENNMVLQGPPGVGKTTIARIVAEILFGLEITDRPEVKEVTEEDIVVGYVSQTATKMREVCEDALGGVLFIDEAPRLVPKTEGHSFGKDAIRTLLKYMEDYRDKLVVVVAGYPDEMPRFLDADSGLRSRFNTTLTFASYTPAEIEQIGRRMAADGTDQVDVAEQAWPLLYEAAAELRGKPSPHGTALDVAGNARFARKVIRACKHERARRLRTLTPAQLQDLRDTDALTVNCDDMARAIAAATEGI